MGIVQLLPLFLKSYTFVVVGVTGLHVLPFSITPPCRQPYSVFGGVYLWRMRFLMPGVYHC